MTFYPARYTLKQNRKFLLYIIQIRPMNQRVPLFKIFVLSLVLCSTHFVTSAQCDIFKSESELLEAYELKVTQLSDSLQTFADAAAFAAKYSSARKDAQKVKFLSGEALNSAEEAVTLASEVQYYSEVCGNSEAKSHAIDAERFAVDARDFSDEAYSNAKLALGADNLGNLRYYMKRSLQASKEAEKFSQASAYAASNAHQSCRHTDLGSTGSRR